MPRTLAKAAGVIALLMYAGVAISDFEGGAGGDSLPRSAHSFVLLLASVCAVVYCIHKLIDSALKHYTPPPALVETTGVAIDAEELRLAVKDAVGELFTAALEEAMAEVYRMGMMSGAERAVRPYIVKSKEGE